MSDRRLAWILHFYPERFRRAHGEEYLAFLQAQRGEARYRGPVGAVRFWVGVAGGGMLAGLKARLEGLGAGSLPAELPRAARRLRRRPGLALAVVGTLGVAMGIATATFAVVDEALLAPLPYGTGDRLVLVRNDIPAMEWYDEPMGRWVWQPLEEESEGLFEALTATRTTRVNLMLEGEPRAARALRATADFFPVFDARPALGRGFTRAEDRPESDAVVVLGHGLWTRLYGGDPSVVGQTLEIDGVRRTVVGVLPEDFVIPGGEAEMVLPLAPDRDNPPVVGNHDHQVYGLLAPGLSLAEAASRIAPFTPVLDERYPQLDLARFQFRVHLAPLGEVLRGDVRATLLLLLGAGSLLLLLASANVANLMLARTEASRMDQSVRLSLGASHGSLAREALAESALLAGTGSAAGLGLAWLALGGADVLPAELLPWTVASLELGPGALAFAGALALLATVVVGILPAWGVRRTRPADLLGAHRGSGREGGRALVRRGLVVSQVFLSVVLLAGATLLGRTLLALAGTDPGFRTERVVAMDVQLPRTRYGSPDAMAGFARTLAERVGALPGVEAAAVTDAVPLRDPFSPSAVRIEGDDPDAEGRFLPDAHFQVVAGDYLQAMEIPLLAGAAPRPGEPGVLVNRAFARELLPEGRALEQRVALFAGDFLPVVGVVGDVRVNGLSEGPKPQIYYPMEAWAALVGSVEAWRASLSEGAVPLTVVVRATEGAAAATEAVRAELRALDPGIPVASVRTLDEVVVADRARPRLTALVVGGLALAGLLLAAVGTYAVLAHSVTARSREIGIRKALGATPGELWGGTTLSGLGLAGVGLVAGLVAAWFGAGLLDGLLYGVEGDEPVTYLGVALLVGTVALAATAGPALRAARVDPVESIRE